jgi:lipoprotein-anchoring transpeptidase ErfK/SrfK
MEVVMLPRRLFIFGLAALLLVAVLWNPAARAQGNALYFPSTGHNLDDTYGFLSFWQAHDGAQVLGFPVTEAFASGDHPVQYFERGRLEQLLDQPTGTLRVQTGNIGVEYTTLLYRTFLPVTPRMGDTSTQFFETTGHTLREPFFSFWQKNGGMELFGAPISEPLWDITAHGQRRVQYFERARLEIGSARVGTSGGVIVGDLGHELALLQGENTAAVPNRGGQAYGPAAAQDAQVTWLDQPPPPTPTPRPQPTAQPTAAAAPKPASPASVAPPARQPAPRSAGKSILVNLTRQWLYAYEDGVQVFSAPVSTGRDGMETPTGNFAIYSKTPLQTMDGVLDGKYWIVPNVPNVMYINGGVALHGTYWHNLFGTGARPSHGCVNLPLNSAAWLYGWAPVGTPVRVTY